MACAALPRMRVNAWRAAPGRTAKRADRAGEHSPARGDPYRRRVLRATCRRARWLVSRPTRAIPLDQPLTAPARARRYKGAGAHGHVAISAGGLHEAVSGIDPGRVRVGGLPP